jgi:hypothetical protein
VSTVTPVPLDPADLVAAEVLVRSYADDPGLRFVLSHNADRAASAIHGPEQRWWRNRLGDELANLRAALPWFDQTHQADAMLQMIGSLGDFWVHRGYLREGREWVERALDTTWFQEPDSKLPLPVTAG